MTTGKASGELKPARMMPAGEEGWQSRVLDLTAPS